MDDGCKHGHFESRAHATHAALTPPSVPFQSQLNTSTFFASFPSAVLTNGWALTTSHTHDAGSDPERYVVHISNPTVPHSHSFADCLIHNSWRTLAETETLTPTQQRAQVVSDLKTRGHLWCQTRVSAQTSELGAANRDESLDVSLDVCLSASGEAMTDEQLLELCLPAWQVLQSEWQLFSASRCVFWGSKFLANPLSQCLPRPQLKAHLACPVATHLNFIYGHAGTCW